MLVASADAFKLCGLWGNVELNCSHKSARQTTHPQNALNFQMEYMVIWILDLPVKT